MPELIDKRETIRLIQDRFCSECYTKGDCDGCEYKYCIEAVEDTPTIEAEPIRYGRWEMNESKQFYIYPYKCSVCKEVNEYKFPYCPLCGARMDEPPEEVQE